MSRYWCEYAWLGANDGTDGDAVKSGVAIEVVGDRIARVEVDVAVAPSGASILRGLTLPGMVNGHSHAFHRGLRGRTHGGTGSFWTWRDQMYVLANRLDPDSYRTLAVAVYAEMLQAGFTTVGEFHYLHHSPDGMPYENANEMSAALVEAASIAGIRITLLDTCYLQAGLAADAELNSTQRRFSDGTVENWTGRVSSASFESSTSRLAAAIHSVRAVPRDAIAEVARWASGNSTVLHAHVSEQPAENQQCHAVHGMTPTELLANQGALGPLFTAVHATHLTSHDLNGYAASGSVCCICPTTERDLADGIGPTAEFRSTGVAMTIGTDSHAVIDPFEEIRAIELNQRLATLARGTHQPGELLTIATSIGARSLGWSDAGRIAVGALADLTSVSLDSVRLAGTDLDDVAAAVVFCATAADVHHVIVGGRVVVAAGHHHAIDVPGALRDSLRSLWS